jgi:hypothetical protein
MTLLCGSPPDDFSGIRAPRRPAWFARRETDRFSGLSPPQKHCCILRRTQLSRRLTGAHSRRVAHVAAAIGGDRSAVILCSECGKTYRVGEDATVIPPEAVSSYAKLTLTLTSPQQATPVREDSVASLDARPDTREETRRDWKTVRNSLSRGDSRTWRCHACKNVNPYNLAIPGRLRD